MKALVFDGPGKSAWQEVPDPAIVDPADVIVRVEAVTIRGTDLHILKGDVPEVRPGTVLGHEAVGEVLRMPADGRLPASSLVTHTFELDAMEEAYDVFARAADTGALEVVLGGERHDSLSRATANAT